MMKVGASQTFTSGATRRFPYVWRCLALAAFLALLLSETLPVTAKESASARERVMVFGDSLSASYGINPKEGWVTLLGAKLQSQGVAVVNASISGETTLGGLNRIKGDLARLRPTIVILALGANDGLRGLPNANTRKNLEAIIVASRSASARVVLVGVQIPPNYGPEYTKQFREMYADLAGKYKLPLVPFLLEGFADNLDLFQADRLHPTAAAQPRIVDNVTPALAQAIAKPGVPARR